MNLLTNTTTGNSCTRVYTRTWDATDACERVNALEDTKQKEQEIAWLNETAGKTLREIADAILRKLDKEEEEPIADLLLDGVKIDRLARVDTVPFAGLMLSRATDQLSEVSLAREATTMRGALARNQRPATNPRIIVPSVGIKLSVRYPPSLSTNGFVRGNRFKNH